MRPPPRAAICTPDPPTAPPETSAREAARSGPEPGSHGVLIRKRRTPSACYLQAIYRRTGRMGAPAGSGSVGAGDPGRPLGQRFLYKKGAVATTGRSPHARPTDSADFEFFTGKNSILGRSSWAVMSWALRRGC